MATAGVLEWPPRQSEERRMRLWSSCWPKRLRVPRARVSVVGGQTARRKIVEIEGLDLGEIERRLSR